MDIVTEHTPGLLGSCAGCRRSRIPDRVHGVKQVRPVEGLSWACPSHLGWQTFFLCGRVRKYQIGSTSEWPQAVLRLALQGEALTLEKGKNKGSSLTKEILHHSLVRRLCCFVSEYDEIGC